MLPWFIAGLGLLLALAALHAVRRLSRRVDSLNQSYWELRYDYTRLRSRLSRLDPEGNAPEGNAPEGDAPGPAEAVAPGTPPATSSSVTFVPLSTIRKKEKKEQ